MIDKKGLKQLTAASVIAIKTVGFADADRKVHLNISNLDHILIDAAEQGQSFVAVASVPPKFVRGKSKNLFCQLWYMLFVPARKRVVAPYDDLIRAIQARGLKVVVGVDKNSVSGYSIFAKW